MAKTHKKVFDGIFAQLEETDGDVVLFDAKGSPSVIFSMTNPVPRLCTDPERYMLFQDVLANIVQTLGEGLTDSRSGISMTKHELRQKDMVISPLISQGQSPYQIVTNHPELDMSVRTLYTYLDEGLFTARNIDLKRKV